MQDAASNTCRAPFWRRPEPCLNELNYHRAQRHNPPGCERARASPERGRAKPGLMEPPRLRRMRPDSVVTDNVSFEARNSSDDIAESALWDTDFEVAVCAGLPPVNKSSAHPAITHRGSHAPRNRDTRLRFRDFGGCPRHPQCRIPPPKHAPDHVGVNPLLRNDRRDRRLASDVLPGVCRQRIQRMRVPSRCRTPPTNSCRPKSKRAVASGVSFSGEASSVNAPAESICILDCSSTVCPST